MKRAAVIVFIVSQLNSLSVIAQKSAFKPSISINFDSANGYLLLSQCSRGTPPVNGYWSLQRSDIDRLEANFSKIDTVTATGCCGRGFRVRNLRKCGFQYVGILVGGRKCIYVNAFPTVILKEWQDGARSFDLSKQPVSVCDGGPSLWGVVYDVETGEFSELSFNGRA